MSKRRKISFKATKIISKPMTVSFHTKDGKQVEFKARKNMPKSVRVEFYVKRKKK